MLLGRCFYGLKEVKRKLAEIPSADIKGYSRLMAEDEFGTVSQLKEYREVMAIHIQRYRGRVVAKAGVGKSRMHLEISNRLSEDETIFLEGRCLHIGGSMAYLPILDVLKSYSEIHEGDREYLM